MSKSSSSTNNQLDTGDMSFNHWGAPFPRQPYPAMNNLAQYQPPPMLVPLLVTPMQAQLIAHQFPNVVSPFQTPELHFQLMYEQMLRSQYAGIGGPRGTEYAPFSTTRLELPPSETSFQNNAVQSKIKWGLPAASYGRNDGKIDDNENCNCPSCQTSPANIISDNATRHSNNGAKFAGKGMEPSTIIETEVTHTNSTTRHTKTRVEKTILNSTMQADNQLSQSLVAKGKFSGTSEKNSSAATSGTEKDTSNFDTLVAAAVGMSHSTASGVRTDGKSRPASFQLNSLEPERDNQKVSEYEPTGDEKDGTCLWDWRLKIAPLNSRFRSSSKDWIIVEGVVRKSAVKELTWHTSCVYTRVSSKRVQTSSGSLYYLCGHPNVLKLEQQGFSPEFISRFGNGFPPDWEKLVEIEVYNFTKKPEKAHSKIPFIDYPIPTSRATDAKVIYTDRMITNADNSISPRIIKSNCLDGGNLKKHKRSASKKAQLHISNQYLAASTVRSAPDYFRSLSSISNTESLEEHSNHEDFNGDPSSKRVHDLTNGRNAISKYSSNQSPDRTGRPQKTGASATSQTFPESAASEALKLSSKRQSVESRTLQGPRIKNVSKKEIYEVAIRSGIPLETSDSVPLSDLKRKSTHSIDQASRKRRRSRSQSDSSYQYCDSRIAHSRTFKPSNARRTSTASASSSALLPVPSPKFVESKKLSRDRSDSKDHSKPLSIDRIGNKQSKSSSTFIPPAVVVKAVSVNTTRSGRKVTKPLEHWRNEKKAVDENGNVVVVSEQRDKVELYSGRRVRSSQHRRRSQDSTNAVNKNGLQKPDRFVE